MKRQFKMKLWLVTAGIFMSGVVQADGSGKWQSGQEAYEKVCGYCHDKGIGPLIKGQNKPGDMVRVLVRTGSGAMPPFRRSEIDDETLAKLIVYIK